MILTWSTAGMRGALLLMALGWGAQVANAASVTPLADSASVRVGEAVTMSVLGANFSTPLDGGGLDIQFPSSMLQLDQVTIDPAWNFMPSTGTINNQQGTLTALSFNAFPAVAQSSFQIATLEFTATGVGTAVVSLQENDLFVFGSGGAPVPVSFGSETVNVLAVPEPTEALLFFCGLALLLLHGLWRNWNMRSAGGYRRV